MGRVTYEGVTIALVTGNKREACDLLKFSKKELGPFPKSLFSCPIAHTRMVPLGKMEMF